MANRRGLELHAEGPFEKGLDNAPNAWVTTTFIDRELVSTLRVHVASGETDRLPSLNLFSDVIKPYLQKGHTIIETSGLAARLEYSQRFPELPYIALRPAWLAAEYFEADFMIASICEEHQPFYRRTFGYEPLSEPRPHPYLGDVSCVGVEFRAVKERIEARYPVLRSWQAERDALFRRWAPARVVFASG